MEAGSFNSLMPVVIVMLLGGVITLGGYVLSMLLSPRGKKTEKKIQAYECGEDPVGKAWSAFNVRFYVVGLIFIIFDVESALMFPVAVVFRKFKEFGEMGVVLVIFLLFISILLEGIVYCWKKGDLDWIKSFHRESQKQIKQYFTKEAGNN